MNEQPMNKDNIKKMDILFYNSYIKSRNSYILRALFHTLKLLLIVIFLPIDITVLQTDHTIIIIWFSVAIAICSYNILVSLLIVHFLYADNQANNLIILELAVAHEHAIVAEPLHHKEDIKHIKKCVSENMYNVTNETEINNQGLTDDLKMRYEKLYAKIIQQTLMSMSSCLGALEGLSKFASFCSLAFGIVALAVSNPLPAEIGVGVTYLVLEALSCLFIVLFFVALALCPLITIVICFYCCCCAKKSEEQQSYSLPDAVPATADMIKQTDGTCNICLQNFQLKKNVIVLPCSKKHMFHEGCISNWIKFSTTCPLCRYKLNSQHQPI